MRMMEMSPVVPESPAATTRFYHDPMLLLQSTQRRARRGVDNLLYYDLVYLQDPETLLCTRETRIAVPGFARHYVPSPDGSFLQDYWIDMRSVQG